MFISARTKIEPFDLDGNCLAAHMGYDFANTDLVFAAYPEAAGITLTTGQGTVRIVRRGQ